MPMLRLGVTGPDAHPVSGEVDDEVFASRLAAAGRAGVQTDSVRLRPSFQSPPVFGELKAQAAADPSDPSQAGWTFVVAEDDPLREQRTASLRPLAQLRGMADPGAPMVVPAGAEPAEWLTRSFLGMAEGVRPKYVLLAGGPEVLSFDLQVMWSSVGASMGRVAFDDGGLDAYVEKVLRLQAAADPVPGATALVFATDHGGRDVTGYSRRFMAEPIAQAVDAKPPFKATLVSGDAATKERLLEELTTTRPGLVYTASHGYEVTGDQGLAEQRRLNGAILCARQASLDASLLRAEDIPDDAPVAEGSVFFQFACWGYGTPKASAYKHWTTGTGEDVAERPFLGSLAERLLAHPQGPVAYVGHADMAWLHGFADPTSPTPALGQRYQERLRPFLTAVDRVLLRRQPGGYALDDLGDRVALLSVALSDFYDQLRHQGRDVGDLSSEELQSLADSYIFRNDAMYFMVLGDPAARVRVHVPD